MQTFNGSGPSKAHLWEFCDPFSCHLKEENKNQRHYKTAPFSPHFSQYNQKQSGEPASQLSWNSIDNFYLS